MTGPDQDPAAALAGAVHAAPPRAGGTRVLAIDGPSGSGKSTLAAAVAAELAGPNGPAPVLRLDDVYPGWDGLAAVVPRLVGWVLEPLAGGGRPGYRRYDWAAQRYAEWHDLAAAPVVVLEGVGCGARACAPYLSLLVWLDAPAGLRFERATARDGDAYRPHWDRWARQEREHFAAEGTEQRADLRLDGRYRLPS